MRPKWIDRLESAANQAQKHTGGDVWAPITVALPLGDANRLLHLLKLARCNARDGDNDNELVDEVYALATGAMEG